ncbi:MAG: VOC family protein [Actinomycetota bacterium]|nr:VOC family protein [Actinomycetota bacterium]
MLPSVTLPPHGIQIAIDCHDPEPLVAFWCLALGYRPKPPPEAFATWRAWYLSVGVPEEELGEGDCQDRVEDPTGTGPSIWFQPVPEPKTVKNRVHLDIRLSESRSVPVAERAERVEAKAAELEAAGATRLRLLDGTEGHYGVVMQDPEGNEFCLS